MTDTTQPPAETLAIIEMLQAAEVQEGVTVFDHSAEEIGIAVMENHRAVLAALTRRAGGDAIPAGEVEAIATAVMRYVTPHLKHMIAFLTLCEAIEQSATPKPPAGGDAGVWDHRYRSLRLGETILATDECRRDDGTWVTGICVGEKAPDPAYTSHRVYRRLKMIDALHKAKDFIMSASNETGVCMCGSRVDGHTIGDGHSPVDEGSYHASHVVEYIEQALAALPSPTPEVTSN